MRIASALALGIPITIGVACSCAMWSASASLAAVMVTGRPNGTGQIDPNPQKIDERGFGVRGWTRFETFEGVDPSTGMQYVNAKPTGQQFAFGWPLSALGYALVEGERPSFIIPGVNGFSLYIAKDRRAWLVGGLPGLKDTPAGPVWRGHPGRHFPLTPRPLGFTINTLLAAIPLYLLLGGWSDLRSFLRSRKGRCPRCGYDSRGLSACPECGLESPPTPPRTQHADICHLAICHLAISPEGP